MFKYIRAFFAGAYKILFALPKLNKYYKNKDKYPFEERYAFVRKLIIIVFKSFKVKVNCDGFDKLDSNKTYYFVSNHQAVMDALTMIYLMEKPMTFVCKKETIKYPLVGKACYVIDAFFYDRDDMREAVKMIRSCTSHLENNLNVAIYPEGTRTKDENYMTGEYKAGALKPAYNSKKDIVTIAIDGSYKILSKEYKNNLKIELKVMDILKYDEYSGISTNDLASKIQAKTNESLIELRKQ